MKKYAQPVHIISVHVSELGITIGQLSVKSKSNEIPAVHHLIETLNLKGCVVVADALNTPKETESAIIKKEADSYYQSKKIKVIFIKKIITLKILLVV